MGFKERLKYLLDEINVDNKKVTSYRLDKETSISRASFDNYISGRQSPSIENATIIAEYFNVSLDWLLAGKGNINDNIKNASKNIYNEINLTAVDFQNFRKENKMTQEDAATYFGCDKGFISQIENCIRPIPETFIDKVLHDRNIINTFLDALIGSKSTVKDRLIEYLRYKKINKSQFGRRIGVSSAFISSMRNSMAPDKIQSISSNYPDLNIAWLMTGDGLMINDEFKKEADCVIEDSKIDLNKVLDILQKQTDSIAYKDELLKKQAEQIERLSKKIETLNGQLIQNQLGSVEYTNRVRNGEDIPQMGLPDQKTSKYQREFKRRLTMSERNNKNNDKQL